MAKASTPNKKRWGKQSRPKSVQVPLVECTLQLALPQDQAQEIMGDIQTLLNALDFQDIKTLAQAANKPLIKAKALSELRKYVG